jgi:RNA polymerase sigma-70 factor (ECF subfamily)
VQDCQNLALLTEEELGRQAATGGQAAFEEIVRRFSRPLAEFAAGRTVSWQDAEDIVQETFLRAYLNLSSFNPVRSLRNWLFTIAYRLMVSSWRRKKTIRLSDEAAALLQGPDPIESTEEDAAQLWDTARAIGTDAYTVLWLRYRQEMSVEEIAQVMQKTSIGVRVLLHRTRKRLADTLETNRRQETIIPQARPAFCERNV